MKRVLVIMYVIGYLTSWVFLAGLTNAHFTALDKEPIGINMIGVGARSGSRIAFSIAWSGMTSSLWPVTVPGCYFLWNRGNDGWTLKA